MVGALGSVDGACESLVLVEADDGHGVVVVGLHALLETLLVVVGAAGGEAAGETAIDAGVDGALDEEDEGDVGLVSHRQLPPAQVVLVPGEAVDEVADLVARLLHGVLEELAGDLDRDDGAVADVTVDELSDLAVALPPLRSQQIARAQMRETELRLDPAALSPLPRSRRPEYEYDAVLGCHPTAGVSGA